MAPALLGPAAPALADEHFTHLAVDGDTLVGLAAKYLAQPERWQPLQRLNRIADPTRIRPGTPIRIPLSMMRTEPSPAKVRSVHGPVESGVAALKADSFVAEGTSLKTGADGFATLELADGSTIVVQSNSRARLARSQRIPGVAGSQLTGVALESGRLEAGVARQRGAANRFEVTTPTSNMGVRGTRFRVAAERGGSRGEVLEGVVGVASPDSRNELALQAGFGTVVDATGQAAAPVRLLSAPDLAAAVDLQERIVLRFRFSALAGATQYRGQIAADPQFQRLLKDAMFKSPEAKFGDLPDGNYFLRVRGVDARGIEGEDRVLPFRLKARPEPPFLSAPADRHKSSAGPVQLTWSSALEAASYRIQVASDSRFTRLLLDEAGIAATQRSVELGPGDYFWRVASTRADGDRGPYGDAQSFVLKALPKPPDPPKEEGGRVRFSWGAEPGQVFDFQLARDAAFADLVASQRLDQPTITVDKPTSAGMYYMRYRAIDPDGFIGPYSGAQTLEVKSQPWWLLVLLLLLVK
ncbi:MAG TPA: FecR domain-containing protein [Usitatibacteraceae bacterium]|nr:FecR domain-containing protein [Usitatibacteraceae bacterium]